MYQYAEDARASSCGIVVPITLVIMFVLAAHGVPLGGGQLSHHAVGAVRAGRRRVPAVAARLFSMTTAVIIGYVSLFAVAIQTGIIMIEFIREALGASARRNSRTWTRSWRARSRGCGRS